MELKKGVELEEGEFSAFSASDGNELFELDRICRLSPWSLEGFCSELQESYTFCWGKRDRDGIVAFIMAHVILGEAHILKIGVRPDARRQGIATRLLNYSIAQFARLGVGSSYLEVRRSQISARALYEKMGFVPTGERRNYYNNEDGHPGECEDAILYSLGV